MVAQWISTIHKINYLLFIRYFMSLISNIIKLLRGQIKVIKLFTYKNKSKLYIHIFIYSPINIITWIDYTLLTFFDCPTNQITVIKTRINKYGSKNFELDNIGDIYTKYMSLIKISLFPPIWKRPKLLHSNKFNIHDWFSTEKWTTFSLSSSLMLIELYCRCNMPTHSKWLSIVHIMLT